MKKYRAKSEVIETISFEELVNHVIESGAHLHNGMPWSFSYQGKAITHENDDMYLFLTPHGFEKFSRGSFLGVKENGELFSCDENFLNTYYDKVED